MEYLDFDPKAHGLAIAGFPDAERVLELRGPKGRRLGDLALHLRDLNFALESLEAINGTPEKSIVGQALWRTAIIYFMKCFGQSESRFSLSFDAVYKTEPLAGDAFEYFRSLRNKHIVHDENSYMQCVQGAVLNKPEAEYKIAKIVTVSSVAETLAQDHYNNLHLLIRLAQTWVTTQFDKLCDLLTQELEGMSRDELQKIPDLTITGATDVHSARQRL